MYAVIELGPRNVPEHVKLFLTEEAAIKHMTEEATDHRRRDGWATVMTSEAAIAVHLAEHDGLLELDPDYRTLALMPCDPPAPA
jgi:hypothetical protein